MENAKQNPSRRSTQMRIIATLLTVLGSLFYLVGFGFNFGFEKEVSVNFAMGSLMLGTWCLLIPFNFVLYDLLECVRKRFELSDWSRRILIGAAVLVSLGGFVIGAFGVSMFDPAASPSHPGFAAAALLVGGIWVIYAGLAAAFHLRPE